MTNRKIDQTFETKPPIGSLEYVISRLSVQGIQFKDESRGGQPELMTSDIALVASSYPDALGRQLIGVLSEDAVAVDQALEELDLRGWNEWRRFDRKAAITVRMHRKMAESALAEYQSGEGYKISAIREYLGVSGKQWSGLGPHYVLLVRLLYDQQHELSRFMFRRLDKAA